MSAPVPPAGAHGGDGERVARALGLDPATVLDLSLSLNPVAPDPVPVLARHLDAVRAYPDVTDATAAMAAAIGVDPERLLLTNGAAEAIALVGHHLGRGWADATDFALYRRHLDELDPDGPLVRSNPGNPTGRLAAVADRAAVWDESFYPLATGRWTRGDDAVVIGSLTKLLACPGLRIGYVVASPDLVATLRRRQPQWSVSTLACRALPDLLASVDLARWSAAVAALRADLEALLRGAGLAPQPSDANYVLCGGATDLRAQLAPHGVVVRDCASFGLPGLARIAVPDEQGLDRLAAALRAAGWG